MTTIVKDRLFNISKSANIDEKYGPYASVLDATTKLASQNAIIAGLTVGIEQEDGSVKEYWYQPNQSNVLELVKKGGGTDDYADLNNKPQINSVTLNGNKSASDLDLATAAQGAKADTAYQKPQSGIPSTDMTSAVQTSLGKADTALQQHQDISGKADKVNNATNGNFAGLDATGNLTDSGYSASDFVSSSSLPAYTIARLGTPETGYFASYVLQKDGVQEGATINIPKDYLVKSGSVIDVVEYNGQYYDATDTTHTTPLPVSAAGKYLDFVVNTVDSSGASSHIYIAVNDLVDAYTDGNGIDISNLNVVSIQIDSSNSNGLSVSSNGLALATAVASSSGTGGSNGAMTAADKEKLNGLRKMVVLEYGVSTWRDFQNAFNANAVVYCKASSDSNPAIGTKSRHAFLAYNDGTKVEFQYYRSVSSHSATQQGDQVFVYTLTNANAWSVETRETYTKIVAGTNLTSSYSNGVLTINAAVQSVSVDPNTVTGDAGTNASVTNTGTSTAPVLKFTIPRGADAVNPFKGYYPNYPNTKPTGTFADGDYIYAPDSNNGSTITIWYWDETLSTADWSDSRMAIDPAALVEFANTSKAVAATNVVNNLIDGGTTDVLSAEQGKILASLIKANFSDEAKQALITLLEHVAWVDDNGSQYINSLYNLLFAINTIGIRAEYTQSHTVWSDGVSTLDDLKQDLIVYAIFSDNSEVEISGYVLSGTLASGTSIITVTYGGFTSQFNVVVTQYGSINVYSKSNGDLTVCKGAIGYQGNIGLQAIGEYLTINHRKIAGLDYGIKSLEDSSGVPLNPPFYPIKVPIGATQVTATITPNTASISVKLTFLVDNDYWDLPTKPQDKQHPINTNLQIGSATLDIAGAGYSGRSDTYIIVYMKPSSGSFSDNDPIDVNITFS